MNKRTEESSEIPVVLTKTEQKYYDIVAQMNIDGSRITKNDKNSNLKPQQFDYRNDKIPATAPHSVRNQTGSRRSFSAITSLTPL